MKSEPTFVSPSATRWHQLLLPKEHGSWSLALEPVTIGLLLAPSKVGFSLAGACLAGFFARRPFKIALTDNRPNRRTAARSLLAWCVAIASIALAAAVITGGAAWLAWLMPAAAAVGLFLYFDLRNAAREEPAEIAGAIAFAFVPGAMAAAAGCEPKIAAALTWMVCGRAVPTVLFVRAYLRAAKVGRNRPWPALMAAGLAAIGGFWLHRTGLAPRIPAVALAALLCRSALYLVYPRPAVCARNLGKQELLLGAIFVVSLALTWHLPIH